MSAVEGEISKTGQPAAPNGEPGLLNSYGKGLRAGLVIGLIFVLISNFWQLCSPRAVPTQAPSEVRLSLEDIHYSFVPRLQPLAELTFLESDSAQYTFLSSQITGDLSFLDAEQIFVQPFAPVAAWLTEKEVISISEDDAKLSFAADLDFDLDFSFDSGTDLGVESRMRE